MLRHAALRSAARRLLRKDFQARHREDEVSTNVNDPFWGTKLIEKVAENILSALTNPEEAIFKGTQDVS
jgi:hypothetical protein